MLRFPNAKINLGLNIVEKRSDGFHNIETIFYPIPLTDGLEIADSNKETIYNFSSSGIPIKIDDKDNIVCKAFDLLYRKYNIPSTNIHLHKNIPFGAGLGGGSSDAAFMIKMLNEKYKLELSFDEMKNLAGQLGSDCPFFIANKPVFAEGKGDVFSEILIDLSGYHILLVKPNIHISTPEAYSSVTPSQPNKSLKELITEPIQNWKNLIFNDFENSIFPNHPKLENIKNDLYNMGAVYASMSGSGSSLFGIFKVEPMCPEIWSEYFCWKSRL
ncbi:4-(cytidine 5'-diphospho)-2-C-methyl-D-erythritol kinase [Labilibaculum sp. A4]|uniref:4-(cytidine 5'-diphospho)-2-C-methyl-D-erythritol kinase n=1 Tax=Labilibaculum euxinus TaxID=2686357 RepID=UPI000F62820F|nr:4-(cytidine 5'-diphospho)-2-C-methyl-D-erythritol kinase [Labilibaculum euxinus]MDQ1771376.1 4-(cytidine 5'-diphospho)-2-C-methyl-D-erythritol kinase [Labilibaculum euxinus]MWN77164.1 4-(cytidine 5'-diphospho)-2-C-methyl-D-erythritol kinase [Labilibaculum euxinus]